MWPYWILFAAPSVAALFRVRLGSGITRLLWGVAGIALLLMIGLRHEVGGDWLPYAELYDRALDSYFDDVVFLADPGYALLTWIAAYFDLSIYAVNLVCASVFVTGIIAFCRQQPNPALALTVSIPLMVILLAMGYTRQATAMGFELLALTALAEKKRSHFFALSIVGSLFHRSSILLLPLVLLSERKNVKSAMLWTVVLVAAGVAGFFLLSGYFSLLWGNYVVEQKESEGGMVRVVMNALPALLLLVFRRRLFAPGEQVALWMWVAVLSLVCLPLAAVASTAADRVALYLSPLQIVVLTRLPRLFEGGLVRSATILAVITLYAAIQFVWLNFALNASAWVPYQMVFFQ